MNFGILSDPREKDDELERVLAQINPSMDPAAIPKTIIFMNRKHACDDLADSLRRRGYSVDTLHGDKSQALRTQAMFRFRTGRLKLLVATDVAARGLDVKDIQTVINYDFPSGSNGVEDYVHRIGKNSSWKNETAKISSLKILHLKLLHKQRPNSSRYGDGRGLHLLHS